MTDPAWLDLEHLTAQIYAELAPDAVLTHNDHIQGGISGSQRQIDISIRTITAGHELVTIIDTKDQGRPLEIADVDAFSALVEDVRANKGILIGRSGFTEGARQSARARGLDLCRVHDTANRRWSQDVTIPILWRELVPDGVWGFFVPA